MCALIPSQFSKAQCYLLSGCMLISWPLGVINKLNRVAQGKRTQFVQHMFTNPVVTFILCPDGEKYR